MAYGRPYNKGAGVLGDKLKWKETFHNPKVTKAGKLSKTSINSKKKDIKDRLGL